MESGWLLNTIKVISFFIAENPLPYVGMLFWFVFSAYYVRRAFANFRSINEQLLQFIPFVFSALGLLGTVAGALTVAWNFDVPNVPNLTDAAKLLFKGILGAGASALVGFVLAMVFSKLVNMTQIKEERQKALQNRELFVLKKMFALMKADYDRDGERSAEYAGGLQALQEALGGLQQGQHADAALLIDALQEPGEHFSRELAALRSELAAHFKMLIDSQNRQNALLGKMNEALGSDKEHNVTSALLALQEQTRTASQNLEQRIVGMQSATQQQAKAAAAALQQTLDSTRQELGEAIRTGGAALCGLSEQVLGQVRSLDATAEAARKELGDGLAGLAGLGQTMSQTMGRALDTAMTEEMPQLLEQHGQKTHQELARHADALLTRIDAAEQNTRADLGAMVFAAEEHTRKLQGLIEGASARVVESRGPLLEKLQAIVHGQQSHAQDAAGRASSLARELAGQFREAFATAEKQQLQELVSLFDTHLSAYETLAADLGASLNEAFGKAAAQARQAGRESAQKQQGELAKLAQQVQALAGSAQHSKERMQELAGSVRRLSENNQALDSVVRHIKNTETSMHSLDQAMEKIKRQSQQRGDLSGSVLAPAFAQQADSLALPVLKDELSKSMHALLRRLGEVEAIKKSDARFWKQVEKQIQDGIPIIMGGNKLDLQHTDLDADFRNRLSQSFMNLDRMLETIVLGYKKRANGNGNGSGNGTHARSRYLQPQGIGLS